MLSTRLGVLLCAALAGGAVLMSTRAALGDSPGGEVDSAAQVASSPDLTRDPTLYVVGYAHLDSQWRWAYPRAVREMIPATLRDNFALFEKYPSYIFNFSGSNRYRWMKEYYPQEYERMREYVAAGRWFPCGSSMEEGDAIVPGAESLLRNVLYGNQFFRRELGRESAEFMLPDCFGFPASLPSILAHCGIRGFSTQKLTWGSAVGVPFNVGVWEGPDGAGVLAALNPGAYVGDVTEDLSHSEKWLKRLRQNGEQSGLFVDYHYFGTGDMGGAPKEDSVRFVEQSVTGGGPIRVRSSTADQMFLDLQRYDLSRLPRYRGEMLLTEHSAGSITSQGYMKRWNRLGELQIDAAERAAAAAAWLGGPAYPRERILDTWTLITRNQFHDNLPGTSHPKAYEYCWNDAVLALNYAAGVIESSVASLAEALDTQTAGIPVIVYNPLSIDREDLVEATLRVEQDEPPAGVRVVGPDGQVVPAQVLERGYRSLTVLFLARVPSVGLAVYDVQPVEEAFGVVSDVEARPGELLNRRYKITVGPSGDVTSIFDRRANRELLAGPHRLALLHEKPREWPAWNMDWADRQKPPRAFVEGPAQVRAVEFGPARATLEVVREADGCRYRQWIRLGAGDAGERVEIHNEIDWQGRECVLKADFPLTVSNPQARYNWGVGTVLRGNNDPKKYEVPTHQWIDLTDAKGDYGVTLLTGSKYGSDKPADNQLRITLLYTPGVRGEYQDQGTQDWGRHEITYGLVGHAGSMAESGTDWHAWRLERPLIAFQSTPRGGPLGRLFSLVRVGTPRVRVLAVKQAEESDEIVVRLVNLDAEAHEAVELMFAAPVVAARHLDGQERPKGDAVVADGKVTFKIGGYGLETLAVRLGPPPAQAGLPRSQPLSLPMDRTVTSRDGQPAREGFDAQGHCLPAELLPAQIEWAGVRFALQPHEDGKPNAVTCRGQAVALPAGDFNRVYVLAAAIEGDQRAEFRVGDQATRLVVQDWSGYVGQWDNRAWRGEPPEVAFLWPYELVGLEPGYIKPAAVAWSATHRHDRDGRNQPYEHCYLYAYALELPVGAKVLQLPDNERVRVLAVTAARCPRAGTSPATTLTDTLRRDDVLGARIKPAEGSFDDAVAVTIEPVLFGTPDGIRYTLNGSDPRLSSARFARPFILYQDTTIKTRMFDKSGRGGPLVEATLRIKDQTPPRLIESAAVAGCPQVFLRFSEPLEARSALDAAGYAVVGDLQVRQAVLSPDGHEVVLTLSAPPAGEKLVLRLPGIRDRSPGANAYPDTPVEVSLARPVAAIAGISVGAQESESVEAPLSDERIGTPQSAWTISFWVHLDAPPPEYSILAGFGDASEATGRQRYICAFPAGIHFWASRVDVPTNVAFDVGRWQMVTATYDGRTLRILRDGRELASASIALEPAAAVAKLAPRPPWRQGRPFVGRIRDFTLWDRALPPAMVAALYESQRAKLP